MKLNVEFVGKMKFKVKTRDHEFITDLPEKLGGDNEAPTPSHFFISSLASCVGVFIVKYLNTAKLNPEGLSIEIDAEKTGDHSWFNIININIRIPNAELGKRKKALLRVAEKCVIHQTLVNSPGIKINIEGE